MKYSDKPIFLPRQDTLNRKSVAQHLAQAIDGMEIAKEGFVIGVEGEWGTGKTSLIELILWYLSAFKLRERSQNPLPGYAESEPWTLEQLESMQADYNDVMPYLRRLDNDNKNTSILAYESRVSKYSDWLNSSERGERAAKYWRLTQYVEAEKPFIVVKFSPWLIAGRVELATALLSELARAIGNDLNNAQIAIKDILQRFSDFAPVVGAGAEVVSVTPGLSSLFRATGGLSKRIAETMAKGPTLDDLKIQLKETLEDVHRQRILVIVDDIDRLEPHEALEIVSLVKSLCDLPNVIFILSYERRKLCRLINRAIGINDNDYLSKIVQYPFTVPPLRPSDLEAIFRNDIGVLLPDLSDEELRRLGQAWRLVLQYYLSNPRALKRYLNSLSVSIAALRDYVDPIDYMVLEALRIFEIGIYNYIRANIGEFAS